MRVNTSRRSGNAITTLKIDSLMRNALKNFKWLKNLINTKSDWVNEPLHIFELINFFSKKKNIFFSFVVINITVKI